MKRVKTIEVKDGETTFNLASTEANDDWIRAARMLKEGKLTELERMNKTPMYYRDEKLLPIVKKKGKKCKRNKADS
jgi:hypothetical protein